MKIAVCVDSNGVMTSLYRGAGLQLYERQDKALWQLIRQVPLSISSEMDILAVKNALRGAIAELDDCKVLLSTEVRGLLYSLLQEEMGFRTWKSEGDLQEQLDQVVEYDRVWVQQLAEAAAEAKRQAAQAAATGGGCGCGGGGGGPRRRAPTEAELLDLSQLPQPEQLSNGCYRINLEQVLEDNKHLNSRQVLIPFLETTVFQELEILCNHVPRWFSKTATELAMIVEYEDLNGPQKGLKLRVRPQPSMCIPRL